MEDTLEALAERQVLWAVLAEIIREELTPRQRQALLGRIIAEKPLVVLAAELGTDKDAVYKLIHDARRHLRRALLARGLTTDEVLAAVEPRKIS